MKKHTVAVLGGGIVGAFVFNTLSLQGVNTILLEKSEDVGQGATKANSGIIHAGYDAPIGTLEAKFNVEGNKLYEKIAKRLGESIKNCGSLVVGGKDSLPKLNELIERGKANGVKNMEIVSKEKLHKLEPNLTKEMCFGLYAKDAKIISPYNFAISLCEEAVINGGKVALNFDTKKIEKNGIYYKISSENETVECKYIINCTAENVNEINSLIDEKQFEINLVKGEYMLFDHTLRGLVNRPIFPLPTEKSKGILVCPACHGNVFVGPTAKDVENYDTSFSYDSISEIKAKTTPIVNGLNFKKVMKLYAGVRVKTGKDFSIDFSQKNKGYVSVCGICSPGLSSAPALANYIVKKLAKEQGLKTKKIALKRRKPYTNILSLSPSKLNKLIKKDANYGEIICNCETISKGEILEVLRAPIAPKTTDGGKRRLRATMGHCQGSFCYAPILKIMSNFYKVDESQIKMKGAGAMIVGDVKEGGIYGK